MSDKAMSMNLKGSRNRHDYGKRDVERKGYRRTCILGFGDYLKECSKLFSNYLVPISLYPLFRFFQKTHTEGQPPVELDFL